MSLNHEERAARRRRAAEKVREGATVLEACEAEGISETLLRRACNEAGVAFPGPSRPPTSGSPRRPVTRALVLLAALFDGRLSLREVALQTGSTVQRVQQVYSEAVALGIPGLPKRRVGSRTPRNQGGG